MSNYVELYWKQCCRCAVSKAKKSEVYNGYTVSQEHSRQGAMHNIWYRQKSHDPTGQRTGGDVQSDVTRSTANLAQHTEEALTGSSPGARIQL